MGEKQISLHFGFLVPTMAKQLKPQGYRLPRKHIADEMNIAISSLGLARLLTDAQKDMARKKLAKRILRDLIPIRRRTTPSPQSSTHEKDNG